MSTVTVNFIPAHTKDSGSSGAPVLGPGTLEPFANGLRVRGRRTKATLATVISVIIGVIGIIIAATLLTTFEADLPTGYYGNKLFLAIGLIFAVFPGMLAYRVLHKYLRGAPVDVLVPWSAVRVLAAEGNQTTLRLVAQDLRGDVTAVAADPRSARALWALSGH